MGCTAEVRFPTEARNRFSVFSTAFILVMGSTQAAYPMGTRIKLSGLEADHSPPSSVAVKNVWSYSSTHPIHLRGVVLNKAMDQRSGQ
jgi:hypothetical protein